jgi:hypothetical protein
MLCDKLNRHYASLGRAPSQMCTISLPRDREFRTPAWRPLDPNAHIGTVKEGFFWQFLAQQVRDEGYYNPEHRAFIQDLRNAWPESSGPPFFSNIPKEVDPALIERAWRLFGGPVRQMIEAGALRLETARFDLNFDGVPEPVYRMSSLVFEAPRGPADPVQIRARIWSCDVASGRDEDHPYAIFVRHADAPAISNGGPEVWAEGTRRQIGHLNDAFWYRGRPYLAWILPGQSEFVVDESEPGAGHGFRASTVCQMRGVHSGG